MTDWLNSESLLVFTCIFWRESSDWIMNSNCWQFKKTDYLLTVTDWLVDYVFVDPLLLINLVKEIDAVLGEAHKGWSTKCTSMGSSFLRLTRFRSRILFQRIFNHGSSIKEPDTVGTIWVVAGLIYYGVLRNLKRTYSVFDPWYVRKQSTMTFQFKIETLTSKIA